MACFYGISNNPSRKKLIMQKKGEGLQCTLNRVDMQSHSQTKTQKSDVFMIIQLIKIRAWI